MTALFPDLREQLGNAAAGLAEPPNASVSRSRRGHLRRPALVFTAVALSSAGAAAAAGLSFWQPDPGVTEAGVKRQAVADPPPWDAAKEFELFRRPQTLEDRSPQAAAALREARGPIYARTAYVRRLPTPPEFEAYVLPAGETKASSEKDQICLWLHRTTGHNGSTLCVSWQQAIDGKLHLSLAPELNAEAEAARGRERVQNKKEREARGEFGSVPETHNYLPSETGFTVVGLVPDRATSVKVNGEAAHVKNNGFVAAVPEAGNIVTKLDE